MSLASMGGNSAGEAKERVVGSRKGSREPTNCIFSSYLDLACSKSPSAYKDRAAMVNSLQLIVPGCTPPVR